MQWTSRVFRMAMRWHWNTKISTASPELPEFLSKGKRRDLVQEDLPVLAGFPNTLRPRCLRGRTDDWFSSIGCSDHGIVGQGSSTEAGGSTGLRA